MAAPTKIQLFGHSFVTRLKKFIREEPSLKFNLGLQGNPLVQFSGYSGATIETLSKKFEVVSDFAPDILIMLVGTNDIYNKDLTAEWEVYVLFIIHYLVQL